MTAADMSDSNRTETVAIIDSISSKIKVDRSSIDEYNDSYQLWRFHAILSAYLSLVAGILEATLSIWQGHAEISMSLCNITLLLLLSLLIQTDYRWNSANGIR